METDRPSNETSDSRPQDDAAGRPDADTDKVHRILSGQALTRRELRWAAIFVVIWFLMDLAQFIDWLVAKL